MKSIYNVPVIPQNLQREETIVQIAESLNYLQNVANDIINRVNTRITANQKQLSEVASRVDLVNLKIKKLSGAKKATQVFSSNKYPAADVNKRYESIFTDAKSLEVERFNIDYKSKHVEDEPVENLLFYHVKVKNTDDKVNLNGLGDVPKDIMSVNDFLLFNTSKNLYNHYDITDSVEAQKIARKEDKNEPASIGAAPASISDRTIPLKSLGQNFAYMPNLGDVPALEVPIHLPDLPGVADDLRYINDFKQTIAPSVVPTPVEASTSTSVSEIKLEPELELPPIPTLKTDLVKEVVMPEIQEEYIPKPVDNKPPTDIQQEIVSEKTPPPIKKEETTTSSELPPLNDNAHASLMDAIRKAGGKAKAMLKPASSMPKTQSAPVTGDLMTDLHAKLAMRRKGISGNKPENNNPVEPGSAMLRISAMIPPPPPDDDSTDNNDDHEWDD